MLRARAGVGCRRSRARTEALAEAYLVHRDCADGAALDVMRSQVKFQSVGARRGDSGAALPRRAAFAAHKSCGDAGVTAEPRRLARVQAAAATATAVMPDVGR